MSGTDVGAVPPHVLVVDDEEGLRDLIATVLREAGLTVTTAACGQEALADLQGARFDLMIVDFGLPDVDGLEVLRRVRADPRSSRIPALLLTGEDVSTLSRAADEAGGDVVISKPFSLHTLQIRVSQMLAIAGGARAA